MFQSVIDFFKRLFGARVAQPSHDTPSIPAGEASHPDHQSHDQSSGVVQPYRALTLKRWQSAKLVKVSLHASQAKLAMKYKESHYDPVEKATGIPWWVVAAFDMREESFNHNGYLGNGDPLSRKTVHVPAGRGPFATWYAGAIDALHYEGFDKIKHWDIVTALIECEIYNGSGYKARGIPSPYVWAGTNIQVAGKFVADGKFSPTAWDTQPGCAGLFLALKQNHGVDLNEA